MTGSQPFASNSGVRAVCTRCGRTWPAETLACSSCGAEIGGETVIDARRVSADAHSDTPPNGRSVDGRAKADAPSASALSSFAERTDEEIDPQTSVLRRDQTALPPTPRPSAGSSSDPPTSFVRGYEQHIELPTGSVVDDFEVDARLGAGAMGVVYSARHVKLGRRVAIKVIAPSIGADPQALARFEREAKALASIHHPNIVDVYAFGTLADERSYFAMELLSGRAQGIVLAALPVEGLIAAYEDRGARRGVPKGWSYERDLIPLTFEDEALRSLKGQLDALLETTPKG